MNILLNIVYLENNQKKKENSTTIENQRCGLFIGCKIVRRKNLEFGIVNIGIRIPKQEHINEGWLQTNTNIKRYINNKYLNNDNYTTKLFINKLQTKSYKYLNIKSNLFYNNEENKLQIYGLNNSHNHSQQTQQDINVNICKSESDDDDDNSSSDEYLVDGNSSDEPLVIIKINTKKKIVNK